jgi:hypothetical protein
MNTIETIVPISIENLKKWFTDKETVYIIDYENSTLKGKQFLTYLSNLDLPSDVKNPNFELIKEYLNCTSIINVDSLENIVINILLQYKELVKENNYKDFIKENEEIISKWCDRLDSLILFNMYIIKEKQFSDYVKDFPIDNSTDLIGINFVSLLKHERFYLFYNKIKNNIKFYEHYFNDYMFRGFNLYSFWSNSNNPLFLLTIAIIEGKTKEYLKAREIDREILKNVTFI